MNKSFPIANVKALDEQQGIAEMIVSVFGNVDSANERVMPGFFTDSLKRKLPKGVWMHDWSQPVAKTIEAEELLPGDSRLPDSLRGNGGLYIKGQFNLNTQRGKDAFSDLTFGTVDEFSFGYEVEQSEVDKKDGVRNLVKGEIFEWSPVLVGCNRETALLATKEQDKNAPGGETKGEFLGEYIEASMTMAALSRLNDALFYMVLYDCLYNDDLTYEERRAKVEGALQEFAATVLRVMDALLQDAGESAEEAAVTIKALWRDPEMHKTEDTLSLTGRTLETDYSCALTAWSAVKGRLSTLKGYRCKQGRTLSQTNRDRLNNLLAALSEATTDIQTLLDETDPSSGDGDKQRPPTRFETRKAITDSLRIQSQMLGRTGAN